MNTHVSDLTHTRSSGWPVLYASIFQLLFRHQSSKHTTLKIHLTQRQAGIVWSTTVLVPSYQSDWKRNLPMYVFGRIELSVSLAVSLWQCSPQIALNRSTCFLWMGKIGPIYIFTHRYWSQQVFLFSKWHLPKALSQKLPSRPIHHQILQHVLHICAFLPSFLGSGCLTAGTIFHISLHSALMSLCTRPT